MQISNLNISITDYKLSYYNFFLTYESGESIIFNSLYRSLLAFNPEETYNLHLGQISEVCKNELIDNHILIPNDWDELTCYEEAFTNANNHSEVLSLAIMPTLACNCACPYCFERKTSAKMDQQTEQDILNWIVQQLPAYKVLSVDWFGGEPLLHKDIIQRMSQQLISKCKEFGVIYTGAITTNGVLMNNQKVIDMFKECQINNVQVTFDGGQSAHDAQKFLNNGRGTYLQLLKNATLFCKSNPSLKLRIRVNVSDANYHTIDALLHDLEPLKNNIVIFFRWVYANGASNWTNYSEREKGNNPYRGIYLLQKSALEKGFAVDDQYDKPQLRFSHCEADSQGFYTIDPLGNLYVCVHEYDVKYAVGNVKQGVLEDKLEDYINFRKTNALIDQECRQCKLLPMCNGGCRRYRINHKQHLCIDEKQSMELYIDMLYQKTLLNF